jgi:hypothetical protein
VLSGCCQHPASSIQHPQTNSGHHFFGNITAEKVYITIETDDKSFTEVLEPEYKKYKPNGDKCPPVCMQANLEFYLE